MKRRYGLLGFLSLIGVAGVLGREPSLYPFLVFAIFFEYLFVKADEMFIENMQKAGAWAFYVNLLVTTAVTCYCILIKHEMHAALLKGVGAGFGLSLMVFCFISAWFDWKDRRGVADD